MNSIPHALHSYNYGQLFIHCFQLNQMLKMANQRLILLPNVRAVQIEVWAVVLHLPHTDPSAGCCHKSQFYILLFLYQ